MLAATHLGVHLARAGDRRGASIWRSFVAFASPVLADMDKDGKLDVIQAALDGNIYVFRGNGNAVAGWPVSIHYSGSLVASPRTGGLPAAPAVADWNNDGFPDILIGSSEELGNGVAGAIYLVDGRGTAATNVVLKDWPVTVPSPVIAPLVAQGASSSPGIATIGGVRLAAVHGTGSAPWLLPFDPGAQTALSAKPANAQTFDALSSFGPLTQMPTPDTFAPLFTNPSLGDVDQDGTPDIVTAGASLDLATDLEAGAAARGKVGRHMLAAWSGKKGTMLPGSPMPLDDYGFASSQAIADLNGDDFPEIITAAGGYFLHAFDGCGREPTGWPKRTGQTIVGTPAVGDLDGDHKLEVVAATRDGWIYVWHTDGNDDGIIEWESSAHDARNTANLDTPLTQGTAGRKAATPLTVQTCAPSGGTTMDGGSDAGKVGGDAGGGSNADGGEDASGRDTGPTSTNTGGGGTGGSGVNAGGAGPANGGGLALGGTGTTAGGAPDTAGTGGLSSDADAAAVGGGQPHDVGGCGCRLESRAIDPRSGSLAAVLAILIARRRRDRRRTETLRRCQNAD